MLRLLCVAWVVCDAGVGCAGLLFDWYCLPWVLICIVICSFDSCLFLLVITLGLFMFGGFEWCDFVLWASGLRYCFGFRSGV